MAEGLSATPSTAAELRALIVERSGHLSKRLQQVAHFVLDHPEEVALETLAVLAERSGAQPSTIVRFAKSLGFSGSTPMQRLLRDDLLASNPGLGYGERVRRFNLQTEGADDQASLLDSFVNGDLITLQNMRDTIDRDRLEHAIDLIDRAGVVYLTGMRRAFPVAAYLTYALLRGGKPAELLDGAGGLMNERARLLGQDTLLLATSFHPYAPETIEACALAVTSGAKVLAITDSLLSPIAERAAETLMIREAEVRGFRSLSATMCLAQTLAVGLAWRHERGVGATRSTSVSSDTQDQKNGKLRPKRE